MRFFFTEAAVPITLNLSLTLLLKSRSKEGSFSRCAYTEGQAFGLTIFFAFSYDMIMRNKRKRKSVFHRVFILFVIFILPTFLIREYKIILSKKDYRVVPKKEFRKISIQSEAKKAFVFVVITHNAAPLIEENVQSILRQNYPQYKVVYLDRGSTDGTVEKIKKQIQQSHTPIAVEVFSEKVEEAFFKRYYQILHNCRDEEVVIHLYAEDWLAHEEVLETLNQTYANPDVWLSYGQHLAYVDYKQGRKEPRPKKTLCRKKIQRAPWMKASLKTFYAGLFKKIAFQGDQCSEYFLSIQSEKELLAPLIEMGKAHVQFIPDILSIHHEALQTKVKTWRALFPEREKGRKIRPISPAMSRITDSLADQVDVILFSHGNKAIVQRCLLALHEHVTGISHIDVIDKTLREKPFKDRVLEALLGRKNSSSYVLFLQEEAILCEEIDLRQCVSALQKTGAYGFYLNFTPPFMDHYPKETVYSWTMESEKGIDHCLPLLEISLYRKVDLERSFKEMPFTDCASLKKLWMQRLPRQRAVLSVARSKSIVLEASCKKPQRYPPFSLRGCGKGKLMAVFCHCSSRADNSLF